ncbi:MAG: hypothetical protein IJT69_03620 [Clostridia bacterium]|nr:hypothetical protein [Clostridia bacterium]
MKKKTKTMLSWGLTILAAACGVAAFFVVFADAVSYQGLILGSTFTGLQIGLGYTVNNVVVFEASAGVILAYLLPLLAACVLIIGKGNRILALVASALMITGGVLAFCTLNLLNGTSVGVPALAAGSVASGVLSLVGGITACGTTAVKG